MINLAMFADVPEISNGPSRQHATFGDPVSLICGYNLKSNPPSSVTWSNPRGERVLNSEKYSMDDGPEVVQLNISNVTESDGGTWKCSLQILDKDVDQKENMFNISLSVLGM